MIIKLKKAIWWVKLGIATVCLSQVYVFASDIKNEKAAVGIVIHVSDGDTVWVKPTGKQKIKIRIEGIDAPEICQPGGIEARQALIKKLQGREIQLQSSIKYDDFQRNLTKIFWENEDIGEWMVKTGNAWSYRFHNDPGPYIQQQYAAKKEKLGIWQISNPIEPKTFRHQNGVCKTKWSM